MKVMLKLIGLVKPLAWAMTLAIVCGVIGNFCAVLIPVLGIAAIAGIRGAVSALTLCAVCGVLRGAFRYAEQTCNHYIAFKLLALIRERIFEALRKLCPAKLEGRSRGELISLITADVELLEVFYAHTISPVGELGSTLSGGERQRIGLARAFLREAPLLLLDEPTSNLDSLNEGAILKALREECAASGHTVALVSHRKSTMGVADTVYSVESGRVS